MAIRKLCEYFAVSNIPSAALLIRGRVVNFLESVCVASSRFRFQMMNRVKMMSEIYTMTERMMAEIYSETI